MREIEYILAVDFGTANTKLECYGVAKKEFIPINFDFFDGKNNILPTVVEKDKFLQINFLDTPGRMKESGNITSFKNFVRKLFEDIINKCHFLIYDLKDVYNSNFLCVISYPNFWTKEEGEEFLRILQEINLTIRFAIPENIAFKTFSANIHKDAIRENENSQNLLIDFGASKTSLYYNDEVFNYYGFYSGSIELGMFEKAMTHNLREIETYHSTSHSVFQKLKNDFQNNKEIYILRMEKERFESIEDNSVDKTDQTDPDYLNIYRPTIIQVIKNLKGLTDYIKTHYQQVKYVTVNGDCSDILIRYLRRELPNVAKIYRVIPYQSGICQGMIRLMISYLNSVDEIIKKIETDKEPLSHNDFKAEMSHIIGNELWEIGQNIFEKFASSDLNLRFQDLFNDVYEFNNESNPLDLRNLKDSDKNKIREIYTSNLNKFYLSYLTDRQDYSLVNGLENYLYFNASPVKFYFQNLLREMKEQVFNPCVFAKPAPLEYGRNKDKRIKAINNLKSLLTTKNFINKIPDISLILYVNTDYLRRFLLDNYVLTKGELRYSLLKGNLQSMGFSMIENMIDYSLSVIINEGIGEKYSLDPTQEVNGWRALLNNINLIYKDDSVTKNWEFFNDEFFRKNYLRIQNTPDKFKKYKFEISDRIAFDYEITKLEIKAKINSFYGITIITDAPVKVEEIRNKIHNEYLRFK